MGILFVRKWKKSLTLIKCPLTLTVHIGLAWGRAQWDTGSYSKDVRFSVAVPSMGPLEPFLFGNCICSNVSRTCLCLGLVEEIKVLRMLHSESGGRKPLLVWFYRLHFKTDFSKADPGGNQRVEPGGLEKQTQTKEHAHKRRKNPGTSQTPAPFTSPSFMPALRKFNFRLEKWACGLGAEFNTSKGAGSAKPDWRFLSVLQLSFHMLLGYRTWNLNYTAKVVLAKAGDTT